MKTIHRALALLLAAFALAASFRVALADEIVTITVEATPSPAPALPAPEIAIEREPIVYPEYPWTKDEIDYPAAVAYAECNTDLEKAASTTVVWNRAHSGNPIFADNIVDVCKQPGEFNRGKVTDRNRKIVEYNLNRLQGRALGLNTGINIPESAVYMGREDSVLTLYDIDMNVVWRCT